MKKLSFSLCLLFCGIVVKAQETQSKDTVALQPANGEVMLALDTVKMELFSIPSNLEYIPADETPEIIADRLSCIQQKIELTYNDRVHAFIDYFTVRDREYTRMVQRRKDIYFPIFEKHLNKYNLPEELKYLSIIESGLNPRAVSRARAVGLWQFMPGTGHYFGLNNDWYVDERMDPEKATDAACRYLTQLYNMFGDWQLALAAYNSGPGTVRNAIRKSGYKKTFWEIYPFLPRETRAYVPQFIAIVYAMNHTEQHNLVETAREEIPQHDTLTVKQYLHFETFANLTGTCLEDMQKLNPSMQRGAVPDNGRKHTIKIPLSAKLALDQNRVAILDSASKVGKKELESVAKNVVGGTYGRELVTYQVRSGDALGSIAYRHNVRVDDVKKWNNLYSNMIHPGQRLNIWMLPNTSVASIKTSSSVIVPVFTPIPADAKTYIVQPGDTLWDISKKLQGQGVTVEKIKTLNNLKSNKLQPGQKLIIG